mmetsp:Transcript_64884/g.141394  ORF Transcript_64884/g.141394 Transcript_64884/m.141394 type:complete len:200 (+) Transcript_64884:78-677(+)
MGAAAACSDRQLQCWGDSGMICSDAFSDMKVLLDRDVPSASSKSSKNHELLVAARDGSDQDIYDLIEAGASVETRRPFTMVTNPVHRSGRELDNYGTQIGLTPLMYAARGGHVRCVWSLLQARADVLAEDEDGMQPLHFAAQAGDPEVARLLISFRADPSALDADGKGALDHLKLGSEDGERKMIDDRRWNDLIRGRKR